MRAQINRKDNEVKFTAETFEDLWNMYKLITPGCRVKSRTTRKYKPPGSNKEERISVYAIINAEKVELHKHSNRIRITGKIEYIRPEYIAPLGSYHTIDVGIGNEIIVEKEWKNYEFDRINEAIKSSRRRLVSIVLVDYDTATFAALRQYGIDFGLELHNRAKKKDKNVELGEFFKEIADEMKKIDGLILLGGPGFVKEMLRKYVQENLPEIAKRIKVVNASNAERSGVYELVKSDEMQKIMEREHMHAVFRDVETFLKCVAKGDGLCAYGIEQLNKAVEYGAIDVLIIIDKLIRENERFERMLENVKAKGGRISIVPYESQIAEQINAFGGAIALLRFRIE